MNDSGEHRVSTLPPPAPGERPQEPIGTYSIQFVSSHLRPRAAQIRGILNPPNKESLERELDVIERVIAVLDTWKETSP